MQYHFSMAKRFTETSLKLLFKQTPSPVFRKIKQYLIKNFDENFNTLGWLIIVLQNTNFNTGTQITKTNTSKIVFSKKQLSPSMTGEASDNLSFYFVPTSISSEDFKRKSRAILPMQTLKDQYTCQMVSYILKQPNPSQKTIIISFMSILILH